MSLGYARGPDGHVHVRTRAVSTAWRTHEYRYACVTPGCDWWSYTERKAERHELRKAHECRRFDT